MSLSVNGQSQVPPGFRFHPTEEELLHYYLKKKVGYEKIDLDVIRDIDLNKLEPWDIQEKCKIGSTPQNDWYFFSHKDKKYPTGTRTNRATAAGFWKATGRDKIIYSNFKRIGMRKTLVFYKGRAPHGQKSDWIMHEYRLDDNNTTSDTIVSNSMGELIQEDGWVVCRVFKKKNHHKSLDNQSNSSSFSTLTKAQMLTTSSSDGALDQIIQYMGRSCKKESDNMSIATGNNKIFRPFDAATFGGDRFMQLPALETSPPTFLDQTCSSHQACYHPMESQQMIGDQNGGSSDWAALDRLVASHLNGQSMNDPNLIFCTNELQLPALRTTNNNNNNSSSNINNRVLYHHSSQDYNNEDIDLWNFNQSSSSSSDPLCHLSNSSV